jgi:hypothetical protein
VYIQRPTNGIFREASKVNKKHGMDFGVNFEVVVRRFDGIIIWVRDDAFFFFFFFFNTEFFIVVQVCGPYPGRRNDRIVFRSGGLLDNLDAGERLGADKGYAGGDIAHAVLTPVVKNHILTDDEEFKSAEINLQRSMVEHVFSRMKRYWVIGTRWRGKDFVDLRHMFMIIAHLTNVDMYYFPIHVKIKT